MAITDKTKKSMIASTRFQLKSEKKSIQSSKARIAKLQGFLKRLERR